jgi:uncharacterized tellurite resistance protein B-like protein
LLRALKSFFADAADTEGINADSRERELQLATAILLIELARADFSEDELELHVIRDLLQSHLSLSDREAGKLVDDAMQQADHSASLQSFTRLLHEDLSLDEKLEIVEMLWRVALADSVLDKHEDHLIRKIAGLLYVSHSDLIRVRNRVRDADA